MLLSISKKIITNFFHSIIMVKFGKAEIAKRKLYAVYKSMKIWDVIADNIVIWKLV